MSEKIQFKQSKTKQLVRTIVKGGFDLLLVLLKTPVIKRMLMYSYESIDDEDHEEIIMFIKEIVKCVTEKYKEESSKIDFKGIINTLNDNMKKDNAPPLDSIQEMEGVLPSVLELYGRMISSELSKCSEAVAAEHLPYERFERVAKAICSRVDDNCRRAGAKKHYNQLLGIRNEGDHRETISPSRDPMDTRREAMSASEDSTDDGTIFTPGSLSDKEVRSMYDVLPTDTLIENIEEELVEIIKYIRDANEINEINEIPHVEKIRYIFLFRAFPPPQIWISDTIRDIGEAMIYKKKGDERAAERYLISAEKNILQQI